MTCSIDNCPKKAIARKMCHMHYRRWRIHGDPRTVLAHPSGPLTPVDSRFWSKVNKRGPFPRRRSLGRCWIWIGGSFSNGYGQFWIAGRNTQLSHRVAWELLKGSIPNDLTIDHLCRNRACVNPRHMELVTNGENVLRGFGPPAINLRKTHCKRGHPLSGKNLYLYPNGSRKGHRGCRICIHMYGSIRYDKKKARA